MWKRESSEEASSPPQSHEYLEAQRSLLPSVQSSSPHMFLPPASAPVFLPSASAPKEPLNLSQVLTGVRELDLVPNRNSSHSYENPMFLPPPPIFLPHAPLLPSLSSHKSWSRAESGRAQQFRSRESIFYPYKEEQILSSEVKLFGKVGLHCYNLQQGTNLQFVSLQEFHSWFSSIISYAVTLEAVDPMRRNSSCHLEILARHAVENKDCLSAIMKESEVEENKEWLLLYAELALLTLQGSEFKKIQPIKPLELRKIIVETKEDVESKKKVKAENAIFYISFKNCCGREYNVIARRTTDGIPEHFSLEVKCC
ncbi:unnamed protein product [Arabidopsis halleri]